MSPFLTVRARGRVVAVEGGVEEEVTEEAEAREGVEAPVEVKEGGSISREGSLSYEVAVGVLTSQYPPQNGSSPKQVHPCHPNRD